MPSLWSKSFSRFLRHSGWPGPAPTAPNTRPSSAGVAGRRVGRLRRIRRTVRREPRCRCCASMAGRGCSSRRNCARRCWSSIPDTAPACASMPSGSAGSTLRAGQRRRPDPFLPRDWQARQGVPGQRPRSRQQDARRTLERLLAQRPRSDLSVPQFDDDAPLLPSPLLAGSRAMRCAALWPGAQVVARPVRRATRTRVAGRCQPCRRSRRRGGQRGGARLLELQAACPFRAQAELRLGARALEEPVIGVAAAERGDLVHAALAGVLARGARPVGRCWRCRPAGASTRVREHVGTTALAAADADAVCGTCSISRAALARSARARDARGRSRARRHSSSRRVEAPREAHLGGVHARMRLDRVDRLADGSLAVIDYKTGADAEARGLAGRTAESCRSCRLRAGARAGACVSAVAFGTRAHRRHRLLGVARDSRSFPGSGPGARKAGRGTTTAVARIAAGLAAAARGFRRGVRRRRRATGAGPAAGLRYCHLGRRCAASARRAPTEAGEDAADD